MKVPCYVLKCKMLKVGKLERQTVGNFATKLSTAGAKRGVKSLPMRSVRVPTIPNPFAGARSQPAEGLLIFSSDDDESDDDGSSGAVE